MNNKPITVQTIVKAPISLIWEYWNEPKHITQWATGSIDWETPYAENDLKVGGNFKTTMAAKDKSQSFDFTGQYTKIIEHELIEYNMDDGRNVKITFNQVPEGIEITETFDPESENSVEAQKDGWQSVLNNFKKYAE